MIGLSVPTPAVNTLCQDTFFTAHGSPGHQSSISQTTASIRSHFFQFNIFVVALFDYRTSP